MPTQYRRLIIDIKRTVKIKDRPAWSGQPNKEYIQCEVFLACGCPPLIKHESELRKVKSMHCPWCEEQAINAKHGWTTEREERL
jgi:hypothetical protein